MVTAASRFTVLHRPNGEQKINLTGLHILLETALLEKKGDTLVKKTHVINGEMIEVEGERFIRERLGLPALDAKSATAKSDKIEVCDPAKPVTELKKP